MLHEQHLDVIASKKTYKVYRGEKMKLFCLHHAGGNGYSYYQWKRILKNQDIIPIDLPGHGSRIQEDLLVDFEEAVDDIFKQIESKINNCEPYAIWGHSMGGLFILYILDKIKKNSIKMPRLVILSGASTPNEKPDRKQVSQMDDDELIDMIYNQGGTAKSLLQTPEFKECFLPIIRADYTILDNKKELDSEESQFDTKAFIFNGTKDISACECEEELKQFFTEEVEVVHYDGGHFYFESQLENVCHKIEEVIAKTNKVIFEEIESEEENAINF